MSRQQRRREADCAQWRNWAPAREPAAPTVRKQAQERQKQHSTAVVPLPRCTSAQQLAENQTEIEPGHMNQLPLEDVGMFAQMRAPHAARVVAMGKATFHQFAAPSE